MLAMVQEIVINKCFGGFGLTKEAINWMRDNYDSIEELTTLPGEYYSDGSGPRKDHGSFGRDIPRDHEALVKIVKNDEIQSDGRCAKLSVVEIPDGVEWEIDEYDGQESVEEKHRSWR